VGAQAGTCRDAASERGRVEQHVVRSQTGRRGHTGRQIRAGCCDGTHQGRAQAGRDLGGLGGVGGLAWVDLDWGCWGAGRAGRRGRLTEPGRQSRADRQSWQNSTAAVRAAALSCSVRPWSYSDRVQMQCSGGSGGNGRARVTVCSESEGQSAAEVHVAMPCVLAGGWQAGRQDKTERRARSEPTCVRGRECCARQASHNNKHGMPQFAAVAGGRAAARFIISPIIRGPGESAAGVGSPARLSWACQSVGPCKSAPVLASYRQEGLNV
jgi:hypothetical protein